MHGDGFLVKILDFGVARGAGSAKHAFTEKGSLLGTPGYMSPEMVLRKPFDGRADTFALGVVLYRMLTGEKPFSAATEEAAILAVVTQPFPPAAARRPAHLGPVPAEVETLVGRMLARRPEHRATMAELQRETAALRRSLPRDGEPHVNPLKTLTSGDPELERRLTAPPPPPPPRGGTRSWPSLSSPARRPSPWRAAAAAVLVLALVGGGLLWWAGRARRMAARTPAAALAPTTRPPPVAPPAPRAATPPAATASPTPAAPRDRRPAAASPPDRRPEAGATTPLPAAPTGAPAAGPGTDPNKDVTGSPFGESR
jgi:serine/threonine-protein kinase